MRTCAVYVDIVDILWSQPRIVQSILHHQASSETLWVRSRDMVSICTHACTDHFGIYLGSASLGVLKLLKYQAGTTLSHHEAVATCAEGA